MTPMEGVMTLTSSGMGGSYNGISLRRRANRIA
jgi:hypothetical protein